MKRYVFKHDVEHLNIENAGHLVSLPDFITETARHFNGGLRESKLHGSISSWNKTIQFLHKYLDY